MPNKQGYERVADSKFIYLCDVCRQIDAASGSSYFAQEVIAG